MHLRIFGFLISMLTLYLSLTWLGWKFTLVLWLAMWGNNLTMAAKLGYRREEQWETVASVPLEEEE
ncbi:MAG: hypothetical protein AAFQ37_07930 [Bacteroidota bacterium]